MKCKVRHEEERLNHSCFLGGKGVLQAECDYQILTDIAKRFFSKNNPQIYCLELDVSQDASSFSDPLI